MFNGIIYDQGIIKNIKKNPRYVLGSSVIEIKSNIKLKKSDIGESVSCDGVCLTLIGIKNKNSFFFYLSKETLKRSNFKNVIIGKSVNMEESLYFGKKISGHYTQGHVDTTAKIKDIKIIEKSWVIDLKIPNKFQKYLRNAKLNHQSRMHLSLIILLDIFCIYLKFLFRKYFFF